MSTRNENHKKTASQAMAVVARIPKAEPRKQKPTTDALNTKLGYQLTALMLILFVVLPGIGRGLSAASNWIALSDDRGRYEESHEARLDALAEFEATTGKPFSANKPRTEYDLSTKDKIETAIDTENRKTERIKKRIEAHEVQKEREVAQREQRILTYIETTKSLKSATGFSHNYTKRQIDNMESSMSQAELAEAKKRLAAEK